MPRQKIYLFLLYYYLLGATAVAIFVCVVVLNNNSLVVVLIFSIKDVRAPGFYQHRLVPRYTSEADSWNWPGDIPIEKKSCLQNYRGK